MRYPIGIAATAMLMAGTMTASHAQDQKDDAWCGERAEMAAMLMTAFGATSSGRGKVSDDMFVEHFVGEGKEARRLFSSVCWMRPILASIQAEGGGRPDAGLAGALSLA